MQIAATTPRFGLAHIVSQERFTTGTFGPKHRLDETHLDRFKRELGEITNDPAIISNELILSFVPNPDGWVLVDDYGEVSRRLRPTGNGHTNHVVVALTNTDQPTAKRFEDERVIQRFQAGRNNYDVFERFFETEKQLGSLKHY